MRQKTMHLFMLTGLILNDSDQCFYYLLSLEVLRVFGAENE